ncbi:hypothetical protein D3C78_1707310 [compost metagenome]
MVSPTSTSIAWMMASVSGSMTVMVEPAPMTESTSTAPPRLTTLLFTASIPTPRPEMALAVSRVENPGAKSRS